MEHIRLITIIIISLIFASQSDAQNKININDIDNDDYTSKILYYRQQAEDILNGQEVSDLSDNRFYRYLIALNSEANCHYMLDNYREIKRLAEQFNTHLNNRLNLDSDIKNRLYMYLYKLFGTYYYGQTDHYTSAYKYAETYYLNSMAYSKYDTRHQQIIYQEFAQLYYKWGITSKNTQYFESALKCLKSIEPNDEILSQQAMCYARIGQLETNNELASKHFNTALKYINQATTSLKKISDSKYVETLRKKGKILMMQNDRFGTSNVNDAYECFNQYLKFQKKDVGNKLKQLNSDSQREQLWLALHQFLYDCVRMGNNAPEMIYDLLLFSKGYLTESKRNPKAVDYTWKDVRKVLKNEDCAIEFVEYDAQNEEKRIGALVLKKNSSSPKFIDIGKVDSIKGLRLYNGTSVINAISTEYYEYKNALFNDSTIFKSIWTNELLTEIGSSKNIYFSPDGFIHQLAIEYMAPHGLNCNRLSSTRVLLNPRKINTNRVLLCGDIDFKTSAIQPQKRDNDIDGFYTLANRALEIQELPGTSNEIDSIAKIRLNNDFNNDIILRGAFATDERFCHLASSGVPIVHIATHGYFSGSNNYYSDLKPAITDHSMSESGLMMAGSGSNINNPYFNPYISDGLLTAKELSLENFSYIDLMILSACQTGLGYITNDGVYGIQRGLKEAGVGAMIVSLWSVNDTSTYEFMKRFYQELSKESSGNIRVAFNKARQSMIENGEIEITQFDASSLSNQTTTVSVSDPFFTNAFILIDAW